MSMGNIAPTSAGPSGIPPGLSSGMMASGMLPGSMPHLAQSSASGNLHQRPMMSGGMHPRGMMSYPGLRPQMGESPRPFMDHPRGPPHHPNYLPRPPLDPSQMTPEQRELFMQHYRKRAEEMNAECNREMSPDIKNMPMTSECPRPALMATDNQSNMPFPIRSPHSVEGRMPSPSNKSLAPGYTLDHTGMPVPMSGIPPLNLRMPGDSSMQTALLEDGPVGAPRGVTPKGRGPGKKTLARQAAQSQNGNSNGGNPPFTEGKLVFFSIC
jgi:hypothetical protein